MFTTTRKPIVTRQAYLVEYVRRGVFYRATVYADSGHRLGDVYALTREGLRSRVGQVIRAMEAKI
jgi:hypothetical protein